MLAILSLRNIEHPKADSDRNESLSVEWSEGGSGDVGCGRSLPSCRGWDYCRGGEERTEEEGRVGL